MNKYIHNYSYRKVSLWVRWKKNRNGVWNGDWLTEVELVSLQENAEPVENPSLLIEKTDIFFLILIQAFLQQQTNHLSSPLVPSGPGGRVTSNHPENCQVVKTVERSEPAGWAVARPGEGGPILPPPVWNCCWITDYFFSRITRH